MSLNRAEAKRQRRLTRQRHRTPLSAKKAAKRGVPRTFVMKHAPITKGNNSTKPLRPVKAPALQKLFSDAFKSKHR